MYQAVAIYDLQKGDFIGYTIKEQNAQKLQTTNLYTESESADLETQLSRLNDSSAVLAAWPDARDPDVVKVLEDPNFMPIEMIEDDMVDEENSYYVYTQVPEIDESGAPTGRTTEGEIDKTASVIVTKRMKVPARPSDVMERTKAACEVVARRRAA